MRTSCAQAVSGENVDEIRKATDELARTDPESGRQHVPAGAPAERRRVALADLANQADPRTAARAGGGERPGGGDNVVDGEFRNA